jgi:hypothetical protein
MVLPFFSPLGWILELQGPEEAKNLAEECPPPDSDPFSDSEFGKNPACLSTSNDNEIGVRRGGRPANLQ